MKRLPLAIYLFVALASVALAAAHTVDGTAVRAELAWTAVKLCTVLPESPLTGERHADPAATRLQ